MVPHLANPRTGPASAAKSVSRGDGIAQYRMATLNCTWANSVIAMKDVCASLAFSKQMVFENVFFTHEPC
jgi:hypothetical protein